MEPRLTSSQTKTPVKSKRSLSSSSENGSWWGSLKDLVLFKSLSSSDTGFNFSQVDQLFTASFLSLCGFALIAFALNFLPANLAGTGAVYMMLMMATWTVLYGGQLTRRQQVYFDEANILMNTDALPPKGFMADCDTPGDGRETSGVVQYPPKPMGLFEYLFADERELEMQKFYKDHYGGMWDRCQRESAELKTFEKADKKDKKRKSDIRTTTTKKPISPSTTKANRSQSSGSMNGRPK